MRTMDGLRREMGGRSGSEAAILDFAVVEYRFLIVTGSRRRLGVISDVGVLMAWRLMVACMCFQAG